MWCIRRAGCVLLALLSLPAQAELPAGVVKIALDVRSESPALALTHDGRLLVSAAVSRGCSTEAWLLRLLPDGRPDPAFGQAGVVVVKGGAGDASLVPEALALQADGRVVLAGSAYPAQRQDGDFLLMRFLPDGRPDPGLDGRGWLATGIGRSHDMARGVTVLADGRIIAAGGSLQRQMLISARYDFAVVAYQADGRLDRRFSGKGKALFRVGTVSEDFAEAVLADRQGRILVAGMMHSRGNPDLALLRLQADGRPDRAFARGGTLVRSFGDATSTVAKAIAVQADGRILLAGTTHQRISRDDGSTGLDSAGVLLRHDDAGQPDPTFGQAGVVRLPMVSGLAAIQLQDDGRIVLLGTRSTTRQQWAAMRVMRLHPDGTPDTGFGEDGVASVELGSHLTATGLALAANGTIFVCGSASTRFQDPATRQDNGLVLFALTPQGRLDTTFGAR
ncbi:delta-60 repeat domain-containing protein [Pseudomonas oryzae]|uniref:Delta-60 repeat domain-containing protein n=1 Tax=Pseudomonas oryzae TaxID=1392877 RepID=A0A1H1YBP1_9PSED|nr:delta-60 repeat domain-containing protein [Pseudomonas oryzae]